MMIPKILFSALFFALVSSTSLLAQETVPLNNRPAGFVSYFDFGVGSSGGEIGFSAKVKPRVATGLFGHVFWNDSYSLNKLSSYIITGLKTKFYQRSSPGSLYLGPLLAVHGFTSGLRPLIGLNAGFDQYGQSIFFWKETLFRSGIELQGGFDINGHGYIGLGINIGIGYYNNGDLQKPPYPAGSSL